MKKKRNTIIIGGGASGLIAAITAARNGADVTIIEQKERLGKKILSTGNGRCNYTNARMDASFFRGEDISIVESVLSQFDANDTLQFFEELGIVPKERNGYYYPKSDQASAVLDVLCMEIERLGVNVYFDTKVVSIQKKEEFFVKTTKGIFVSDAVILSTGGKASPVLGSDGSGYVLAKSFGHTIAPVVPALVQLHGKGTFFKMVSGVRTDAKVSLYVNDQWIAADTGELQLTNYGISGIPVFQISRYAALALQRKETPIVNIDFMPEFETAELGAFLVKRKDRNPEKTAEEFLIGVLNKKLIPVLLRASGIAIDTKIRMLSEEQLQRLCEKLKKFSIEIIKTNSFEQAQICAGGVRTSEVHAKTLESRLQEGLYITGELLDVDGVCGGYNLQWAWATGAIAGKASADF